MMQAADAALYQAKRAGRNRVIVDAHRDDAPPFVLATAKDTATTKTETVWRALIISSNGIQRRLLRQSLSERGLMYDMINDVEHALKYKSPTPPNLILVDMTQIEGTHTAKLVQLREYFTNARIVTIAPATAEPRAATTVTFGADDYLLVPLAAGTLQALLNRLAASERSN